MKPIIIKIENRERIEKALAEAQGRAKERTVNFINILSMPHLLKEEYSISMKALEGCTFECDPNAQDFPGAYKYRPMSTHFTIEVSKGNFKLTGIERTDCWHGGNTVRANLTQEAKDAIIARMLRRPISCYGLNTGYLPPDEIIDLGLYDTAIEKMDDEIIEEVKKECGNRYETKLNILGMCMAKYKEKHAGLFRI
jgi:hypothetical protein